ncbi:glycosyltransferase [Amnibacterium kyonggiense]|uniref:Glycosyltransferase involved in cell wall biosynthesis n=1 Tax=Amnibacterium kyonggiense TaxID=595671 RepID=A0A4R7FDC0_9MICO|nr:glycosyltransferase [Amnibacterium kyonggiense]TDS74945.1 glycosyltransferase involved in cell wall biosynthesis [Amnibacterium kyonggiense]
MAETSARRTALIAHPGAELYGSDRVMLETIAALVEREWRVVLAIPTDGPLVHEATALGAEVVVLPLPVVRKRALHPARLPGFIARSAVGARRVDRLLRSVQPHVLYASTLTVPLWSARARSTGVPVVVHIHESERQAPVLLRKALALPLRIADRIVVNSAFSLTSLTEVMPGLADRSTVVYNGVPGPGNVVEPRASVADGLRIVYVGRISPRKGVDVAIDALHLLTASGIPASLDLVGAVFPGYEWYEEQLREQIARLGLQDLVTFHGFRTDVWPVLTNSDVAVVPSRLDEPFGNTAVEAVLAGRPVVVSAIGGLAEAIDGFASAIPIPADDPAALAGALERVARSWSAFRRTALAMAPIAAQRYATETYRRRIVEHIDHVATGTRDLHRVQLTPEEA